MASPTDSPISLRDIKVRRVLWLWFSGAARALLIPIFAFVFAWVLYFLIEVNICMPFVLEAVAILSVAASSIPSELERTWCRTTPAERLNQTLLHWTVRISVFFTISALTLWYFRTITELEESKQQVDQLRFERKELDKKFHQMEIRLSILETDRLNEALITSGQKNQTIPRGSN